MNHRILFVLSMLVVMIFAAPVALADPFDGMVMRANRGAGGSVLLDWTGGQPTFRVYRSPDRQTVLDPSNQIGTTDVRTFGDTPPSGAIFYYEIKSPCIYAPPEVCNGIDDDCNGTIDGPGSEVNCQLPHAVPMCAAGGVCAVGSCQTSFGDCDLSPANGCESDLTQDVAHCGSCSISCNDPNPCTHDACVNSTCAQPVDTSRCLAPDGATGAGSCAAAAGGCSVADADDDGLNDTWEDAGAIDINCDGTYDSNDVVIPEANKKVKDIYLRISYMDASTHVYPVPDPSAPGCPTVTFTEPPGGHRPSQDSIDFVVRAFAGAHLKPETQPCGKTGDAPCANGFSCVDFACLPLCATDSQCVATCNDDCQAAGGARCVSAAAGGNMVCRKWRLHVDPLPAAGVPHKDIVTYGPVSPSCTNTADQVDLFDLKTGGTFNPKEAAFKHFVLFAHETPVTATARPDAGT